MPDEHLDADALYLMHLMSCALRGAEPEALPEAEGASWDAVYALALSNSVTTTCAPAAAKAPDISSAEAKRWRDEVYKNAVRHAVFAEEREAIFAAMDAVGLAHLSVKGVVTALAYPRPEMRWMCDNDFLFGRALPDGTVRPADERDRYELRYIMEARGYEPESFNELYHDAYQKAPFLNFEPHLQLSGLERTSGAWGSYFDDSWSRARRANRASQASPADATARLADATARPADTASRPAVDLAYEFSREDAYLYHIAHMYKHFKSSGHGVRGVADEWALLNSWQETMDRGYLDAELAKLGMTNFEADLRDVAVVTIDQDACGHVLTGSSEALPPRSAEMIAYMLGSGTYGTLQNQAKNWVREDAAKHGMKAARARYLLHRLFPPTEDLLPYYPILKRAPWLLPAVHLYRFTIRPIQKRARLRAELSAVMDKGGKKTSPDSR